MNNSILEITENEYLIKLNRSNFNLSFIRSLLKMVEVADHSDSSSFIPDTYYSAAQNPSEPDYYYGSLEEK